MGVYKYVYTNMYVYKYVCIWTTTRKQHTLIYIGKLNILKYIYFDINTDIRTKVSIYMCISILMYIPMQTFISIQKHMHEHKRYT